MMPEYWEVCKSRDGFGGDLLFAGKYWEVWEYPGGGIQVISILANKIIKVYSGDAQ